LFITLGSIAPYGQATAAELALASGLSERTIRGAFAELAALQLLGFKARPGEGMTWQLRQDDGVLSPTGTAFYQAKISKVEDSLARRELKVLEAKQAIQDAATGEERNKLRSLAEEAVARVAGRNDDGTESAHAENE
jgi:DNA-binding FadR family transcriptional regulator